MTATGKQLQELTKGMDWVDAKPLWEAASREFAQGASGAVQVFQSGSRGVSLESVWRNVEFQVPKSTIQSTNVGRRNTGVIPSSRTVPLQGTNATFNKSSWWKFMK